MAYLTTRHDSGLARVTFDVFASVGRFFSALGSALLVSSAYTSRVQDFQALHAKSDEELAELGIKRDEIVHHVFQDLYYA